MDSAKLVDQIWQDARDQALGGLLNRTALKNVSFDELAPSVQKLLIHKADREAVLALIEELIHRFPRERPF